MTDDSDTTTSETSLDASVVERAAALVDAEVGPVLAALRVVHAELIGRHSNLEADRDYVTVDGRRAYRVHESVWDEFLAEFDFDDQTATAVRYAHTEQAKLLFASAVAGADDFASTEEGVVIGIDTAEQF